MSLYVALGVLVVLLILYFSPVQIKVNIKYSKNNKNAMLGIKNALGE